MKTGLAIIKNTSVMLFGRVVSLLLGIVYVAALSRYIQAEGMGIIAAATSLLSMLSLLINFGLNDLIIRDVAADKSRAGTYLHSLLLVRGGLILVYFVLIAVIINWTNYSRDILIVIFIHSFSFALDALTDTCMSIFNAFEQMEYPTALQTGRDMINIGLSLAAIALKFHLFIIVGVSVFASLLKFLASIVIIRRRLVPRLNPINPQLVRKLIVDALPFAALIIISVVSSQFDTFVLSINRSSTEVGWYASANLLVGNLLLFPTIFLKAIFPVLSKLHSSSQDELRKAYTTFFRLLTIVGYALCLGTMVTAEKVIELFFGPGFEEAALVLRILSLSLFWIVGYANGSLLLATNAQKIATLLSGISMVLTIIITLILIPRYGYLGAALAHIIPGGIFFLPLTWLCHHRLNLPLPYGLAAKSLTASVLMSGIVYVALYNQVHVLIAVLLIAPCVYGVALLGLGIITKPDIQYILGLFKREKQITSYVNKVK